MKYVIAGDIGGTKTNLALYRVERPGVVALVSEASFSSKAAPSLEALLATFRAGFEQTISAAAFGIAGPVRDGVVVTTNLPWKTIEADMLARLLGCQHVRLMNDLESTAYGALFLPPDELAVINPGKPTTGTRAVIAAGTGLGQGYLFWDGRHFHPTGTEGGHVDFAARNDLEMELLRYLQGKLARVSYERILSGPGLLHIFAFLRDAKQRPVEPEIVKRLESEDPGAVIGQAGVEGSSCICMEAVDVFVSLYGAQAGNLALTLMAVGSVYVGGGIVTKLLPKMQDGVFMKAFTGKGRNQQFMSDLPVWAILNPKTSLVGAAQAAGDLI